MVKIGNRYSAIAGLALGLVCLGGCASGQGGGGRSTESVVMPFTFEGNGPAWVVGYSAGNEVQRILELVRPGQSVENWTELFTVQTFNKAVGLGTVEDDIAAHRKDLEARCPGSTLEVTGQQPDGVLYQLQVVNCKEGDDEYVIARILDGNWNRFVVQYAVRGMTMAPDRRAEWIEKLQAVKIMNLP